MTALLAAAGLAALLPVAWGLAFGEIGLADAGVRAVVTVVAVLVAARVITRGLLLFADTLDGRWKGAVSAPEADAAMTADDQPS
ncbi:MAG: hypothetical protein AAGA99_21840 [Actinomycetota bacterium]